MLFNVSKCKYLHIRYWNVKHIYRMGEQETVNDDQEKDLGLRITSIH